MYQLLLESVLEKREISGIIKHFDLLHPGDFSSQSSVDECESWQPCAVMTDLWTKEWVTQKKEKKKRTVVSTQGDVRATEEHSDGY